MEIKNRIKNILRRKKVENQQVGAPKAWLEKAAKPSTSHEIHSRFKPRKIHVPLLRPIKQVMAGVLCVVNFIIMCATLASNTQPLFWLFFLNFFIILDSLWRGRRSEA